MILCGIFLAVPLLVFAIIYPTAGVAFALSFIVGIGDATAQSGIFPLAGGIHPRCTAAASLGSAIAGLAAGLLRLMTQAIFGDATPEDERISSSVYFAIAVVVLMICALAHYSIQKYKKEITVAFFQTEYAESTDSFLLRSDAIKRSIATELSAVLEEEERAAQAVEGEESQNEEEGKDGHDDEEQNNNLRESFNFDNDEQENDEGGRCKMHRIFSLCMEGSLVYREAFRCAWLPIIAQFVNFFITLSLFPGVSEYGGREEPAKLLCVTATLLTFSCLLSYHLFLKALSMKSSSLGSWYSAILVTAFNAGDMLGRVVSSYVI